ncbi:MAG: hypothetical protein IJO46_07450, partial [Thermoguttaceae bacterium]|nr:hypothetical protein [Thermoguttaceae bacterium]
SLIDSDVGATWGPAPEPAAFSASELATGSVVDTASTISLAALNAVPYGAYVTSEQAAFIALRSNATLADETLADFNALWDDADETTLAETETDVETLSVVAESLAFESLDLGEIEQEPGDVAFTNVQPRSGGDCYISDISTYGSLFGVSSGGDASGGMVWNVTIPEDSGVVGIAVSGSSGTVRTFFDENEGDDLVNHNPTAAILAGQATLLFSAVEDNVFEGAETETITVIANGNRIGTVHVTIVDSPEFISDVDRENGTEDDITNDVSVHWFDTSNFAATGSVNIYKEDIDSASGFPLRYSWGATEKKDLPAADTSPPVRIVRDTGQIRYVNAGDIAQHGDRCGSATLKINAAYLADSSVKDELTLTLEWADVNKAKEVLETLVENSVQTSQILQRSCAQISNQLKVEIEEAQTQVLNIKYAVKEISLYPPAESAGNSPASCGCNPHQAVRVEFRDGSIVDYDRTGAHPQASTN